MSFGQPDDPDYYKPGWYQAKQSAVPKWETVIDRHPDKRRSCAPTEWGSAGADLRVCAQAYGVGTLLMRFSSDASGKLVPEGLATFTPDMLMFGLEAEVR